MSCLLTVTLHLVDVRLTCLINITYLLTYVDRLTYEAGIHCTIEWTQLSHSELRRPFGHVARADRRSSELPLTVSHRTGKRRRGRPRRTCWLRTVEINIQPHNLGLNSARH